MTDLIERLRGHICPSAEAELMEEAAAEIASLRAVIKEAREALDKLVEFHNYPREAQRPDVYQLRMNAIGRALSRIDALDVPAQQETTDE